MVLHTTRDTGITSDTASRISNNEAVHGVLFPPSHVSLQPHPQAGHTERTIPISFTSLKRREYLDNQAIYKSHKKPYRQENVLLIYYTAHE